MSVPHVTRAPTPAVALSSLAPASTRLRVGLSAEDGAILAPRVASLAADRTRSIDERAAWLALGAQLLRQLRSAQ